LKLLATFLLLGIFGRLFASADQRSLSFIDDHLARWDRFARGENDLAPMIQKNREDFRKQLVSLLQSDPKLGVPRLVYYIVLQVGAFIPLDSDLGREVIKIAASLTQFADEKKASERSIFGGYFYLWWREHKSDFASYPPLEEWEKRESSRQFITMYESVRSKEKKP
jgi:hypothetical protein